MAIAVGGRFVRRQNAARTSTSNTTAATISYDTAVIADTGFTYNNPDVQVDTAGLYLFVYDLGQCDQAVARASGTLVPRINTTDQTIYRATHRYLRSSGGAQHGASIGMAILDLAVNDTVEVRNPGAVTPTSATLTYATNASYGGGMQLIKLPAGNFTEVQRTADQNSTASDINTTRPWIDSSGTWTTVTYNSEVNDDDSLYPGTGGDLTLKANKKYMVVWGGTGVAGPVTRQVPVFRLQINGNNVQSGSGMDRQISSVAGPPACGMYLHETGGSTETLRLQHTTEWDAATGTPVVADAYLQVIELPDTAEWIHVDNGATDSLTTALAGTTTWYDTPLSSTLRADGDSNLSLDGTNNAVQNDSGASMPVLAIGWQRWDRDTAPPNTRKAPWSRWDNGGSAVGYGIAGAFSRGEQATDDTHQAHFCAAATMDLANGADLSFQVNDESSAVNAQMGIFASTSRYFLGVQVLNLDSLVAVAPTSDVANINTVTQANVTSMNTISAANMSKVNGVDF